MLISERFFLSDILLYICNKNKHMTVKGLKDILKHYDDSDVIGIKYNGTVASIVIKKHDSSDIKEIVILK